jgi:hypothetical protein
MKKIILGFFCLLFISSAVAQSSKLRVLVSFDMDTTYTVLGPISTKSLNINLTGTLLKQIELLVDTASFQLKLVDFPEEFSAINNPSLSGIPKKNQLASWVKGLRKNEDFDLLLILYKPVQLIGPYSYLEGFSYGLNTSKGLIFSLNDALVFNARTMQILAATSIESESDYIAGKFELDKSLPYDNSRNIEQPIEMINKLNQDFALKVFQCLMSSKKKLNGIK